MNKNIFLSFLLFFVLVSSIIIFLNFKKKEVNYGQKKEVLETKNNNTDLSIKDIKEKYKLNKTGGDKELGEIYDKIVKSNEKYIEIDYNGVKYKVDKLFIVREENGKTKEGKIDIFTLIKGLK